MAVSSNKSPSPFSTRNNTNPRSSSSETQPTRRSFSGSTHFSRPSILTNSRSFNPVTPANSPADFGRRQSAEKGGGLRSSWGCEEKENEKDHNSKAVKLRSPAKGSKNFMSPTISAVSKFTPSPKKRVLVERNDPVRTSMTLSDGKATFFSAASSDITSDFDAKSDAGIDRRHTETRASAEGSFVSGKPLKKVTFKEVQFDSHDSNETVMENVSVAKLDYVNVEGNLLSDKEGVSSDCIAVELCSKDKPPCPSTSSPIIAPLDADPSFPPYDPKTNYLSPRPQFLHYKPNPRTELLLNKENEIEFGGSKRLEDSFMCEMSENLSDSDCSTADSQNMDSSKEVDEATSIEMVPEAEELHVLEPVSTLLAAESDKMVLEPEEPNVSEPLPVSTVLVVESEKMVPEPEEPHVSEPLPVRAPVVDEVSGVKTRRPRLSFLTRWKSVSMLLVLVITCLSISLTDSPVMDSASLKHVNLNLYEPIEVATFARVKFDGLTGKLKEWSSNYVSYLLKLMPVPDKVDNRLRSLQFINLTVIQDDYSLQLLDVHRRSETTVEQLEPYEVEEEAEEDEMESLEDDAIDGTESLEEIFPEADIVDDYENYEETLGNIEIADVLPTPALLTEANEPEIDLASKSESGSIVESEDHLVAADVENPSTDNELRSSAGVVESNTIDIDQESGPGAENYVEHIQIPEVLESSISKSDDNTALVNHNLVMLPVAIGIVAVSVFFYLKQRKTIASAPVEGDTAAIFHKKMVNIHQEKTYSHNWPTKDLVGESCSSEMSSYERSSYYNGRREMIMMQGSEAHSHEKEPRKSSNNKRESFASSSSEYSLTPSYGSFTTYERIPIKHASGDEEIVTPVRRSSRLRNQVTSP